MSQYLVVTGMSGAGRSSAAAVLEDLGWFVIDNLPPALIPRVAELAERPGPEEWAKGERIAFVLGRGGADQIEAVNPAVAALRSGRATVRVLFLDAPDDVLVRRFEDTRRRHPISSGALGGEIGAIAEERRLLDPVREQADVVIDTADMNIHQLRRRLSELFGGSGGDLLRTTVVSFGFKHGIPLDVDLVFDCRFLPNPYWDESLRPLSGRDGSVREFVMDSPESSQLLDNISSLLDLVMPAYLREGRSYLTIAIGCTGGRHRSVVLAEELARRVEERGYRADVFHRDIDRS